MYPLASCVCAHVLTHSYIYPHTYVHVYLWLNECFTQYIHLHVGYVHMYTYSTHISSYICTCILMTERMFHAVCTLASCVCAHVLTHSFIHAYIIHISSYICTYILHTCSMTPHTCACIHILRMLGMCTLYTYSTVYPHTVCCTCYPTERVYTLACWVCAHVLLTCACCVYHLYVHSWCNAMLPAWCMDVAHVTCS